jgi:hypothetical protein
MELRSPEPENPGNCAGRLAGGSRGARGACVAPGCLAPRDRLHLSARGFHRILKLARTIADLDGAAEVGRTHLAEALTYRIDTTRQLRAA